MSSRLFVRMRKVYIIVISVKRPLSVRTEKKIKKYFFPSNYRLLIVFAHQICRVNSRWTRQHYFWVFAIVSHVPYRITEKCAHVAETYISVPYIVLYSTSSKTEHYVAIHMTNLTFLPMLLIPVSNIVTHTYVPTSFAMSRENKKSTHDLLSLILIIFQWHHHTAGMTFKGEVCLQCQGCYCCGGSLRRMLYLKYHDIHHWWTVFLPNVVFKGRYYINHTPENKFYICFLFFI